jgi:hypothetical protein
MNRLSAIFIGVAVAGVMGVSAKIIATVNGYPISLKEANSFVKKISDGKQSYSKLSSADKKKVIRSIATDKLVQKNAARELKKDEKRAAYIDLWMKKNYKKVIQMAEKELSKDEKNLAVGEMWLRKMSSRVKVSEKEIKSAYEKNKKFFKDKKTGKIAPYKRVKPLIKMQLQQVKYVKSMMKKAKIDYNPKTATKKK